MSKEWLTEKNINVWVDLENTQKELKLTKEQARKDRKLLKKIVKVYKDGNYLGYEYGVIMVEAKKYLEQKDE